MQSKEAAHADRTASSWDGETVAPEREVCYLLRKENNESGVREHDRYNATRPAPNNPWYETTTQTRQRQESVDMKRNSPKAIGTIGASWLQTELR
jgi:hypothetical protein